MALGSGPAFVSVQTDRPGAFQEEKKKKKINIAIYNGRQSYMCLQSFHTWKHPVQKPGELKYVFGFSQEATPSPPQNVNSC